MLNAMKRTALTLLSFLLLICLSAPSDAFAANSVGGACKKAHAVSKIGTVQVVCTKVGKKLIWKSATRAPAAQQSSPALSPTPTPSPTAIAAGVAKNSDQVRVDASSWSFSFVYTLDDKSTRKSSTLFIPQGKVFHFSLANSADTSHGFWIPGLSLNKEAVPGETSRFDFTAEKVGTYPGLCNIVCGRGHSGMTFTAQVVSDADFLKALASMSS